MCSRPLGQHTRGKTAGNRLRRVDTYVSVALPGALRTGSPLVVDLGFGARPTTTLELAHRWRKTNPALRVLGVEIDPQRVAGALRDANPPAVDFRLGGFDLTTVLAGERARIVRCMNVLRQYDEAAVEEALDSIAAGIEPGGYLLEGTSDPTGRLTVFDVYRRDASSLAHETLVFATNFREHIPPAEFRTRAPKRIIHRMLEETPLRFFSEWERASASARASFSPGTAQHWAESARQLARSGGWPVDLRPRVLERGFLALRSELL